MFPTMFKIPYLPDWLADIKSYGVLMMIAFLSGIWMACRRAIRSQANPDTVLNLGFIALIFGVLGARIMYVVHYWESRFANQPSPWFAAIDIRSGGLEFWGGPILAIPALVIYLRYFGRGSVRWYLDISAPSLAWGLAITRIGCFLNGCCWGAACVDEHDPARQRAAVPWAVRFPYGSPAMMQQYQFGQLTLPKELIVNEGGMSNALRVDSLEAAVKDEGRTRARLNALLNAAIENFNRASQRPDDKEALQSARDELQRAQSALNQHNNRTLIGLAEKQAAKYGISIAQLSELSRHYRAKPAHPTQLYETISALLIWLLLTAMFYYRERHGILLGWFLMLYSVSRFLLELIRQDNPLDVAGLTISQAISIGTFLTGLAVLVLMYTSFPRYSPRAIPFVLPEESPAPVAARTGRK